MMIDAGQALRPLPTLQLFIKQLQDALGDRVLIATAETDMARHRSDHSGVVTDARPLAVAYPRTTQEVSIILKHCHSQRIPVVPQGGLTGLVGGALPVTDAILVSLERMNDIEEVDLAASTMTVQAGVILQRIQTEAGTCGLSFPLDLGARGSCMIGGNIATNAGGNRVLRFGMTRELVLGLEVVLADGTIVCSLNKMLKNNAGYDLKHLFIGSEGTLGVITRAVLRLFPAPRTSVAAICAVSNYDRVLLLLELARSRLGGDLAAFEVMWRDFYVVATSQRSRPAPLPADSEFYVLIEMFGSEQYADTARFETLFADACEQGILVDAAIAKSGTETMDFWSIRDASGELNHLFGKAISFDISLPIGQINEFVIDCREQLTAALPDARMLVFGHLADSNIHLSCRTAEDIPPREAIDGVIYKCVGKWRGSISAEHGIGVAKRQYLPLSRSAEELTLMRLVKTVLDPNNIMNPGKVLSDQPRA